MGAINYPLVIGGKPLFDFSFSIPVDLRADRLVHRVRHFIGMWTMNGLPRLYHPSMNYRRRTAPPTTGSCW